MNLNLLSRVFWDDVVTDQIVAPFLKRLDPAGEKGFVSLWREHLSSLLDQKSATPCPHPNNNKALVAPPKKKTNYQVFFSLMHPIIKKNEPNVSFRDISKVVSQKWHELSPEQKAAYVDQTPQANQPVLQAAPAPVQAAPIVVDFQEEDDAFQILAGGGSSDVIHDDASTEDSGIDEEEDDFDHATDNEDDYDDDAGADNFDDDDDSKISITDDP